MGIHKRKEDVLKKKKGCNGPFKLLKEMAKFIITVKNKSRIILVKLVTIISVIISSNKGEKSRLKSLLSEGRFFWHLPVKFYRYFRGGGGCYFWEVYGRVRLSGESR